MLTLTITDLEEERRVFLLPRVQAQGSFSFDFQFTHGGRHRVTALAEVDGESSTRQEKIIAVVPVEPAQIAVFRASFLFLGVIAGGMFVGYTSGRSGRRRAKRKRAQDDGNRRL